MAETDGGRRVDDRRAPRRLDRPVAELAAMVAPPVTVSAAPGRTRRLGAWRKAQLSRGHAATCR